MDLSKYIKSEVAELNRSAIHLASYNPREITEESKKALKRIIKKYGLVGGIVVNKRTGLTVVSGHQRITVMDELQKYDRKTKENDYKLRVDVIDVDEKTEKELNIAMNNPNAQGTWNRDKLAEMIPDIDYKDVGLSEADLSLLGLDYMFQTEQESDLANSLSNLMEPVEAEHQEELAAKQAERAAKVAHMKEVKQQVREAAQQTANNMDAYIMLSFDNIENKNTFLQRFGYASDSKYIKGEDFDMRCEAISEE
ncbi:MAG: ParB N-terminal domain-containing protein [Prevotella sp.]|nr:ParB N-terminal domain-containing protein [Prevotella sp.]